MNLFKRTRIIQIIFGVASVVFGIFTAVELLVAKLDNLFTNPMQYPRFFLLLFLFLFALIEFIVLRCIVLDAKEDIKAAFDYASKKEEKSE